MQDHDEETMQVRNEVVLPKDVFISYSSLEAEKAQHVRDILEANGISCWMAPDSIPPGSSYLQEIAEAISGCRIFIVLLSENAQNSEWVISETEAARSENKKIIPYKIEDCQLSKTFAFMLHTKQYVDGFRDEEKAMQQVVSTVYTELKQPEKQGFVYFEGPEQSARPASGKVKWIAAAVILVLAILGGMWWYSSHRDSGEAEETVPDTELSQTAMVYYSEALPFSRAGFYGSYEIESTENKPEINATIGFSILSFVRNYGDQDAVIEKISCDIQNLVPVEEPVIMLDGYIRNNVLKMFIMNDGWEDAKGVTIDCTVTPLEDMPEFSSIEKTFSSSIKADAKAGSVVFAAEYVLDPAEVQTWAFTEKLVKCNQICKLTFEYTSGEETKETYFYLAYDPDTNSFALNQGGGGKGGPGNITLFGVLDVDKNPSAINFSGPDAYPIVQDTFRVEMVILPTKSCTVECKGVYSVNGEIQETDPYIIHIDVPRFAPSIFTFDDLIMDIAQDDMTDAATLERLAAPYRYDPDEYIVEIKKYQEN